MIRLALTLGDVNGIGPEVILKAWRSRRWPAEARGVIVGDAGALRAAAAALGGSAPPSVRDPASATGPRCVVWTPPGAPVPTRQPGRVRADAARASVAWLEAAVEGWRRGWWDGIVTAPINKEGWARAGVPAPGHTEWLARASGARQVGMLLCGGGLRVLLATRHVPLRAVPRLITRRRLFDAFRLAVEALHWLGIRGDIAVCGLNPHAGDGGAIGTEETDVIAPAIRAARRAGWPVSGPWPGDTVFREARAGRYALVVAMYHDQGLAALKTVALRDGVNVTLGLPFVRTSPDHGTAMSLAGRGLASADSMIAALRMAADLARRPTPRSWRTP